MLHIERPRDKEDKSVPGGNYVLRKTLFDIYQLTTYDKEILSKANNSNLKESSENFCYFKCKNNSEDCFNKCVKVYNKTFKRSLEIKAKFLKNYQAHENVGSNVFMH